MRQTRKALLSKMLRIKGKRRGGAWACCSRQNRWIATHPFSSKPLRSSPREVEVVAISRGCVFACAGQFAPVAMSSLRLVESLGAWR